LSSLPIQAVQAFGTEQILEHGPREMHQSTSHWRAIGPGVVGCRWSLRCARCPGQAASDHQSDSQAGTCRTQGSIARQHMTTAGWRWSSPSLHHWRGRCPGRGV